jgi:hypothetical protein
MSKKDKKKAAKLAKHKKWLEKQAKKLSGGGGGGNGNGKPKKKKVVV